MDHQGRTAATIEALSLDPRYRALVAARERHGWRLTGIMLAAYFGFILLVAFGRPWLAMPIGRGVTSLGIPLGLGVILLAIVLTGYPAQRVRSETGVGASGASAH